MLRTGTVLVGLALAACSSPDSQPTWHSELQNLDGALLSVWGTSESDVWAVGGEGAQGPTVMHYDGSAWESLQTGESSGDLWWVTGFDDGTLYMSGDKGTILRYRDGGFTRMQTPDDNVVIFGMWGASPEDMWAVGGVAGGGRGAFAWRLEGDVWQEEASFPSELADTNALWKVFGRSANDAWLVGTNGLALHWDGTALTREDIPSGESMLTVHGDGERYVAVGGFGTGQVFEHRGQGWQNISPDASDALIGVYLRDDELVAVGQFGAVANLRGSSWELEYTGTDQWLHAAWISPEGNVFAVGGDIASTPLVNGLLLYRGLSPLNN